ncbi:hypothetical protein J8273_8463 [Carpediemonas membranifera]|uniref:Uncharacterized protein n=1 Tax=Carpediemonas membranifera TaxID=201153 RepID=A0A8J6E6P5_9EUKA|nr:hypothetical protein J8273_8463 [Carpediemonas membranifera]|eukprot:KAG9389785.1 hypothetical protein J8273_8463 [Carpediemonas membranifera]
MPVIYEAANCSIVATPRVRNSKKDHVAILSIRMVFAVILTFKTVPSISNSFAESSLRSPSTVNELMMYCMCVASLNGISSSQL